jgi:hypothetical protein
MAVEHREDDGAAVGETDDVRAPRRRAVFDELGEQVGRLIER